MLNYHNRLNHRLPQLMIRLLKFLSRKQQLIILPLIILALTFTSCHVIERKPQCAEVVNVKQSVSLREQPEADSRVKSTIPKGEQVEIIYHSSRWAHVKYKERDGYVKSEYLRLIGHEKELSVEDSSQMDIKSLFLKWFREATNTWWSMVLWLLFLISPIFVYFIFSESISVVWFRLWLLIILLIPAAFIAMCWIKVAVDIQHFFLWLGQLPLSVPWGPVIADTHNNIIIFVYTFITVGALYLLIVIGPLAVHRILSGIGEGSLILKVVYAVFISAIIIGTLDPCYTDSMPGMIEDLCRWFQTSWHIRLSEYSTHSDYEVLDVITILLNISFVTSFND